MRTAEEVRRLRLGMLVEEFGSYVKLNQLTGREARDSTLSQIANASQNSKGGTPKEMGPKVARALEIACKKPPGWMDNDPELMRSHLSLVHSVSESDSPEYGRDGYVQMPVMGEAAAGPGREAQSYEVVQHVEVLESWIREAMRVNPRELRVLTARGQSMHGVVEDGDILFVLPCTSFDADGLYIITVEGLLRVKRLSLRISDRKLSIESMDRDPELVPLSAVGETVLVQGRVVGAWGFKKL